MSPPSSELLDVLIVGAGLSGIDAGMHLSHFCPEVKYAVLEGRDSIGGTWDLFRYPGVRSDSDMFTLGFSLKPWMGDQKLADGPSILQYVRDAAKEFHVEEHVRLRHRVVKAEWNSEQSVWRVHALRTSGERTEPVEFLTRFLFICSGYYNYERGYEPAFPSIDKFTGQVVHPQKWDPKLDYKGKQVVIIGSGATAVTLLPAMAESGAGHVTMLQRSPTYITSLPSKESFGAFLYRFLPATWAYTLTRWKNACLAFLFYLVARSFPNFFKGLLRMGVKKFLGPDPQQLALFQPAYNPWEQRLCLVPDGNFFKAMRKGKASVVTGHIDTFTATGIRLKSGQELPADIVVTATGLELLAMGGIQFVVDGKAVAMGDTISYRGVMLSNMPNMAYVLGYLNSSWTLKADLACRYVCRLLQHMRARRLAVVVPKPHDTLQLSEWSTEFSSGYLARGQGMFPKQGHEKPWRVNQNFFKDFKALRMDAVDQRQLLFLPSRPTQ